MKFSFLFSIEHCDEWNKVFVLYLLEEDVGFELFEENVGTASVRRRRSFGEVFYPSNFVVIPLT